MNVKLLTVLALVLSVTEVQADPLRIQYSLRGATYQATIADLYYSYLGQKLVLYGGEGFTSVESKLTAEHGESLTYSYNRESSRQEYLMKLEDTTLEYEGVAFSVEYVGLFINKDEKDTFYFELKEK